MPQDSPLMTLNLKNLKCPLPVLKTRKAISKMHPGDQVLVITNDPMAVIDFPHFCNEEGHKLIKVTNIAEGHKFLLECAGNTRKKN